MVQRAYRANFDSALFRCGLFYDFRQRMTVFESGDRLSDGAILHPDHKVDDRAAFTDAEVVPQVRMPVDFETGRAFFPQRREIHTVAGSLCFRSNSSLCKIAPDADSFYSIKVHSVVLLQMDDAGILLTGNQHQNR